MGTCAACPHPSHNARCGAEWDKRSVCTCEETRPGYILATRAQALDRIQELIEPFEDDQLPPPDVWRQIVIAAFPPPPMA
jgi:hypothetical protein